MTGQRPTTARTPSTSLRTLRRFACAALSGTCSAPLVRRFFGRPFAVIAASLYSSSLVAPHGAARAPRPLALDPLDRRRVVGLALRTALVGVRPDRALGPARIAALEQRALLRVSRRRLQPVRVGAQPLEHLL